MVDQNALAQEIRESAARWLAEDVGSGDVTAGLIPERQWATARVSTHQSAVLCGVAWVEALFHQLDPRVTLRWEAADGDPITPEHPFLELEGPARSLFSGERAALNLLRTLSATATTTRAYVDQLQGTHTRLFATSETLPGLRAAQHYAVTCGGGHCHRLGLWDAFVIKAPHIGACGGVKAAIGAARRIAPALSVAIEVATFEQLDQALAAGADTIMLRNFELEDLHVAVEINGGRALLEAVGSVEPSALRAIADTGVDAISLGALTRDVTAITLALRVVQTFDVSP
ncbi:carboxylating nicotinate-nucleotide diphosphorylase [Halomonas sp. HNIBRBA4712]|uniref:carboxylating nicotinate-nucleotide diphosphorylase n=1 Tax=Halomonas sp. HNIBRBA4712 TaxID=3373087 RepID=UPI0037473403